MLQLILLYYLLYHAYVHGEGKNLIFETKNAKIAVKWRQDIFTKNIRDIGSIMHVEPNKDGFNLFFRAPQDQIKVNPYNNHFLIEVTKTNHNGLKYAGIEILIMQGVLDDIAMDDVVVNDEKITLMKFIFK
ncbi:hypothetical protein EDEG_01862 [Edhazardia aedis USNM 41457]|uniref:Uncharacterized protein n=1 Tax=Edhazardia aedis (strain USNM 41457) TaxID=1003232 RepID=J8ZW09_EDHAE|nr:hypothetical protein EDEG_01862 [Edhazardia aedis USNM 41457]|eukprot:EJW03863.1 hypothetical protein EDEG_01862 [Edhazardia aedis USNM 41457]